jgi:hypothetical protein
MSTREPLPDSELTEAGRISRRTERCVAEYDINFGEVCAIVAMIARHRHGLATRRCDLRAELVGQEGLTNVPGFEKLRRRGLAKCIDRKVNQGTWVPTLLAIQKFAWAGVREQAQGASAAE